MEQSEPLVLSAVGNKEDGFISNFQAQLLEEPLCNSGTLQVHMLKFLVRKKISGPHSKNILCCIQTQVHYLYSPSKFSGNKQMPWNNLWEMQVGPIYCKSVLGLMWAVPALLE